MVLPPLAVDDHVGVEADRRVVDEHPAVDLGDVDPARAPGGDRGTGPLDLERHAKILGEVVERAQRQHAERHVRSGQEPGRRADGPVPATNHDTVDLPGTGLSKRPLDLAPDPVALGQDHLGLDKFARERGSHTLA